MKPGSKYARDANNFGEEGIYESPSPNEGPINTDNGQQGETAQLSLSLSDEK